MTHENNNAILDEIKHLTRTYQDEDAKLTQRLAINEQTFIRGIVRMLNRYYETDACRYHEHTNTVFVPASLSDRDIAQCMQWLQHKVPIRIQPTTNQTP